MKKERIDFEITNKIRALTSHNSTLVFITIAAALGQTISVFTNSKNINMLIPNENVLKKLELEFESRLQFKNLLLLIRDQILRKDLPEFILTEEASQIEKIVLYHKELHKELRLSDGFLKLGIEELEEGYILTWEGCVETGYWETAFESFQETFYQILKQGVTNPNAFLSNILLISDEMKRKIMDFGRGKESSYPLDLVGQIHNVVEKYPEFIAVTAADRALSYKELWEYSSKLACVLRENGVKQGDCVAIYTSRNIETIVGIVAIIMAGATYVPIETDYGIKRIKYMIEDSNSNYALSSGNCSIEIGINTYKIDFDKLIEHDGVYENIVEETTYQNRYIIYTSGSTGKPKGVAIKNEQLMNLCNWYIDETKLNINSKLLLLNVFGFDASVKNIFSSLITGSELILGPEYLFDVDAILGIIMKHKVTLMNCVPSLFYRLMDIDKNSNFNILKNIKLIVLGGEAIEGKKIMEWAKSKEFDTEIMNVYGPTECTSVSTFSFLKKNELLHHKAITIGNPIYNKQIYVLNDDGRICPIYAKGELCISGIGTIDSYIGEFKQTRNVFSNDLLDSKLTLYHTGDIVYWNQDGELIFVERKDNQVKIDGHRIELGEIEQALLTQYTEIKQCCVLLQEENHHNVLVAHVIMNQETEQLEKIDESLSNWLPSYMIPKKIFYHNTFPLTPHGKIDYKKIMDNSSNYEKKVATNDDENLSIKERVANIWRTLLFKNDIDYNVNFFDAGGYSLLLYKLSKMIEIKLNCKVTFVELMTYTTINTFSEYIEGKMRENSTDSKQFAKLKFQEMKNRRTKSW